MSYAIGNIIYGIPLTDEIREAMRSRPDEEEEDLGFEMEYSGSAPYRPGWCGVRLDTINECIDTRVWAVRWVPTDEERAQAAELIAALPAEIRAVAGEPDVYIVWSSS